VGALGGLLEMSSPLLLGIDAGTSAVKVALFDPELEPLATARRPLRSRHPKPDWVEQDPDEHVEAVVEAVGEAHDGAPAGDVACGLDHQGESVVAWHAETKEALSPIVVWQCKRSMPIVERLQEAGEEEEIRRRSGLPLDPYFSAGKLTWLRENVPAVEEAYRAGVLRFGTLDAFVCDRLGAGFATDPSTASRTQLAPIGGGSWDSWLCERFDVPIDSLPEIADTTGTPGTLSHPSWSRELTLCARLVDQQAALAGTGCLEAGTAKATYGTGVFVLAHVGSEAEVRDDGLLPTVAWRIAGRTEHAVDGGVFAAGSMLEWLSRTVGLADDPVALCALAADAADSGGVRVLPAITGLGAPWWQPQARGVIAGLTAASGPREIARAALEGIAWRVADVVEAVRHRVDMRTLRVDGGLSNDPLLLSLQADAVGIEVERMPADATVRGAALLAGVGAGVFETPAAAAPLLRVEARAEPTRDASWRSAEGERWKQFVELAAKLS
jgi:glycerol kinase